MTTNQILCIILLGLMFAMMVFHAYEFGWTVGFIRCRKLFKEMREIEKAKEEIEEIEKNLGKEKING